MIVDIEEVYDQFNHGIFNPLAIQKFLRHTYTHWRAPKPTYVLLVGDAHYDYKSAIVQLYRSALNRRTTTLHPIYVPTFHGWGSLQVGETSMDHRFCHRQRRWTHYRICLLGRLPVQSSHELADMVKKIIDYEAKQQPGLWQSRLMQVADKRCGQRWRTTSLSETASNSLRSIFPSATTPAKVYLRQIESPETHQTKLSYPQLMRVSSSLSIRGTAALKRGRMRAFFRIADAEESTKCTPAVHHHNDLSQRAIRSAATIWDSAVLSEQFSHGQRRCHRCLECNPPDLCNRQCGIR